MKKKPWYFGPSSEVDMFADDEECESWIWIADSPNGLLDDEHIASKIEPLLPPDFVAGLDEECESIFSHTSNSYELIRDTLVAAGFIEHRNRS